MSGPGYGGGSAAQGVATTDSPQFATVEVGHATDTTLARSSAGVLSVEGNVLYAATGTDVPITDGGTGSSTAIAALVALGAQPRSVRDFDLLTSALSQTIPRWAAQTNLAALTTATLFAVALPLYNGDTISTTTWRTASTGSTTLTHSWCILYSAARSKLASSADDTTAEWTSNTARTFTFGTPYAVTSSGLYYLALCVVAVVVPTLRGQTGTAALNGLAPIIAGTADGSMSVPADAPATMAALTQVASIPWVYVS